MFHGCIESAVLTRVQFIMCGRLMASQLGHLAKLGGVKLESRNEAKLK